MANENQQAQACELCGFEDTLKTVEVKEVNTTGLCVLPAHVCRFCAVNHQPQQN